jgi:Flp pilus assembly protein TadD
VRDRLHTIPLLAILILGANGNDLVSARPIQGWTGTETSHFAIYTAGEKESRSDVLEKLETARLFLEQTSWADRGITQQVDVLAFSSDKEYESYRINPGAYAFYQRARQGDYVVMRDLSREHYSVLVHEYTHFMVEHSGLKFPLWLNEGLADFYSTVECRRSQVELGAPPSGRDRTLNHGRWMDWATLTAVDHYSPYYQQPDKMMLFYAQSWALVHMLALDASYGAGFQRFLATMSTGASTEAAMQSVYGKNMEQVGSDLEAYVAAKKLTARQLNLDLNAGSLEPKQITDANRRVEFALAQVMAANPQTVEEGKSRLRELAAKYPEDPRAEETLGFLAMRAGAEVDAQAHFAKAVGSRSQDTDVMFRLAHLKLNQEGPTDAVFRLLNQVLAIDSKNYNARLELGFAAAKTGNLELAVDSLEKLGQPKAEHAYVVKYTLAYCLVELNQGNRARMYAEQARALASSKEREQVAGLLRYIEQESTLEVASR